MPQELAGGVGELSVDPGLGHRQPRLGKPLGKRQRSVLGLGGGDKGVNPGLKSIVDSRQRTFGKSPVQRHAGKPEEGRQYHAGGNDQPRVERKHPP